MSIPSGYNSTLPSNHVSVTISPHNEENLTQTLSFESKEANSIALSLLEGLDINEVDIKLIPSVLYYLNKKKKSILEIPDYQLAFKIDQLHDSLSLLIIKKKVLHQKNGKIEKIKKKINELEKQLKNLQETWNLSKNNSLNYLENSINKLKKVQIIEINKLDNYYSKEPPAQFRKLSNNILNLISQEKSLRFSGKYSEAQLLKEEIEALSAYELYQQKINWEKEWQLNKNNLIQKHNLQILCLEERHQSKFNLTEIEYLHREKSLLNALDVLNNELKIEQNEIEIRLKSPKTQNRGLPILNKNSSIRKSNNISPKIKKN